MDRSRDSMPKLMIQRSPTRTATHFTPKTIFRAKLCTRKLCTDYQVASPAEIRQAGSILQRYSNNRKIGKSIRNPFSNRICMGDGFWDCHLDVNCHPGWPGIDPEPRRPTKLTDPTLKYFPQNPFGRNHAFIPLKPSISMPKMTAVTRRSFHVIIRKHDL